jgi:iron(III) transport system substrate-binding protein
VKVNVEKHFWKNGRRSLKMAMPDQGSKLATDPSFKVRFDEKSVIRKVANLIVGLSLVTGLLLGVSGNPRAQADWKERWAKTVEAAEKEGRIVVHAGPGEDAFYQTFQTKYPKIKMVYIPGHGGQRIERIMSERRAGQYQADIYIGGGGPIRDVLHKAKILDPIKSLLILPEVLDTSGWWGGRHIYLDPEGEYIRSYNGITQSYFHYNTKLVDPSGIKSYWDLLDPKWKGKMVTWEPMAPGTDGVLRFLYHTPEIGPQFLRRFFTEMDITVTRDARQFVDWLATGKFLLAGLQSPDRSDLYEAKRQGLPVSWFDPKNFKEGVPLSTSSGNIAVINRAPHPNAVKVFVNWLLSRDGQIAYQTVSRDNDSLRIDIPKEDVPSQVRRVEGVKYVLLTDPAYLDLDSVRSLVNEVWKKKK